MILQNYTRRAQIGAASVTTIQFAASALTRRPIVLAKDGRVAVLTAAPTALTISGTAGTRYIYADLAAPSGDHWYSDGSTGLLDRLLAMLALNRLKLVTTFRLLFSDDQSLAYAAQNSAVTLVESATAPASETTAGRIPLGQIEVAGGEITSLTSYEGEISVAVTALINGQCKLTKSGTDLKLLPWDGNSLVINGAARAVPAAGVTLAPTGLTPDTTYFLYASWSGAAIALEASTTAYAVHTDGTPIKSGDATRALVGQARIITGPAWVDTDAQRGVRSWANDPGVAGRANLTADRTTTSTSFVALHAEIQVDLLLWANEQLHAACAGEVSCSVETQGPLTGISVDSTTAPEPGVTNSEAAENARPRPAAVTILKTGLAEGWHSVRVLVAVTGASTGTWEGTTSPRQFALSVWTLRR